MCGDHHLKNLLVLRSPLLSFTFTPYVRTGMELYRRYAAWRSYLSQNIGPAVAESAGPAPPPLLSNIMTQLES